MTKLTLSLAIGDYDRVRPLIDGTVRIDGVEVIILNLEPEEIFFRAFRHAEFDLCELSLSTFCARAAAGDNPYVGIPVFPSRAFRHGAIYIRTDRGIARPEDLKGRRIGTPEYQLTANVWARAILWQDHGVAPADITWVRGGQERPGRVEKARLALDPAIRLEPAPPGATLSGLLEAGEIDGLVAPRAPSCFERGAPQVGRLFADPAAAGADWFRRTRIFPAMHVLGLRRALAERHPWLPGACLKAFAAAKAIAVARLADTASLKVTLPFVEETLAAARRLMGEDYWPYGVESNRTMLDFFLDQHHRQGVSSRRLAVAELFHPGTLESFVV